MELWPYQKSAVEYAALKRRCFIADEMGLGKSVMALRTISRLDAFPAVIVCPAVMKLAWERMIADWLPQRSVQVIYGKSKLGGSDLYVVNYDILERFADDFFVCVKPKGVVLDESHYIKNKRAQRTKAAKRIAKSAYLRLCLTGTPVENRPEEFVSQLTFLDRIKEFGGEWMFKKRYAVKHKPWCTAWQTCECGKNFYGYWDFSGADNLIELHERLTAQCYIRRTKQEVQQELPEFRREIVPMPLEHAGSYVEVESDFMSWMVKHRGLDAASRAYRAEAITRMEVLKQVAAAQKLPAAIDWIRDALESGTKLVVFTVHREVLTQVRVALHEFHPRAIEGNVSSRLREEAIEEFQHNPEWLLLLVNIKAGGQGIELTASSNCVFLEMAWTPTAHDQAEARLHRTGQKDAVTAWYLIAPGTIEEEIFRVLEKKREVIRAAVDGITTVKADVDVELEVAHGLEERWGMPAVLEPKLPAQAVSEAGGKRGAAGQDG